ncbi:MAG: hypothetical protein IJY20_08120 [Clostridia bacterium]|nr:hypothetical protein [Clostridia bacterium]
MGKRYEYRIEGALSPLVLLLCLAGTLLAGLLSYSLDLLLLAALALATALQAVLYRSRWAWLAPLFTALSLLLSYVVTRSYVLLLPLFSVTVAAFFLARSTARGENRTDAALALTGVYAIALAGAVGIALVLMMRAAGETNLIFYLDRMLETEIAALSDQLAEFYQKAVALYASAEKPLAVLTAEDFRETLLSLLAILPGLALALCYLLSLAATYLLQLVALLCGNSALFAPNNRVYHPSAWLAGAYLVAMPVTYAWGDVRHAFCLVCMNITVFAAPLLSFGVLLALPRLFAFMRRMSVGRLDFTFFAVLLCLFAFSYAVYALPILAFAYAIYILKSTFSSRKRDQG